MILQAVLLLQSFAHAQVAETQVAPEIAALLESGASAEDRGDLDQAIVDFQKAADLAPSAPLALMRLGEADMRKHDYGAAIPPLKHAVELTPDSIPVHQLLGYALLSQGYASEAIPHLQMAHESGTLGIAQLETDQPAEAIINLKDALAIKPNDPDLLYYLSRAGAALSSESKDKLLMEFSRTARGHQALGQDYYAAKMFPEAEKEYERAMALRPDLPGLHLELGEIYSMTSEWAKAEEQFRTEASLQPGSAEAAYRLGEAFLRQGRMREAARELQRSNSLRPDMPETLYSIGRACAIGDPAVAEHALLRVIALERQTSLAGQAYLLLAEIHQKQGKAESAGREMQEYKRIQNLVSPSGK